MLNGSKRQSPCCFAGANDELVVGASRADNGIYIWSATDGEGRRKNDLPFRVLRGHEVTVRNVRYSDQSGVLASSDDEGIVNLWSTDAF